MTQRKNIIQEEKMEPKQWNVISLGAGVQSSTMALMASRGELLDIEVDFAIFADTQDESKKVYDWLDWLERQLSFPVYRVTKGKLSERVLEMRTNKEGRRYSKTDIPFYTLGIDGSKGIVSHRSCTADYKIKPILKELRARCGIKRGQKAATVTSLIGISYDEMQRMKDSRDAFVVNRWPLVELRMKRADCIKWMTDRGYPEPPRSSCVYCPFHRNGEWRRLKTEEPSEFQKAVDFEKLVQLTKVNDETFDAIPFLHNSRIPLDQVDFRSQLEIDQDRGQGLLDFQDECEGMCGV
jgi:hypothetical protein